MRNALRLGRIYGIEIGLNYSWFIVFALVTWSLAAGYFPMNYLWPASTYWIVGVITSVLFFVSVLAHELGHSLVAIRKGIPVRSITLFIFGGMAQITKEPERPRDEFLIAIAGPVVSVVLGLLFRALSLSLDPRQPTAALAFWLGWMNLSLAIFNLIPGFPLDGGRVLRSLLWSLTRNFQRATQIATIGGHVIAYGFIGFGLWILFNGNWVSGLWLGFIGWFLESATANNSRQVVLRKQLVGVTARQIMMADCPHVPRNLTLQELVDDHILKGTGRSFSVVEDGRSLGIITLHQVKAIPQEQWAGTTVGQAMTPLEQTEKVRPDQGLFEVLELMTSEEINQIPVIEDGKLLGMISREHALAFLATRAELGEIQRSQPHGETI